MTVAFHARLAALLALAVTSSGLAGCGAAEPSADAESRVSSAGEKTARAGTARVEARFVERGEDGELAGRCEGAMSYAAKRYRFLCRHAAGPGREQTVEIELVSVGGVQYVRSEGDEMPFTSDPDKPWVRLGHEFDEEDLLDVFDPVALLELLRNATQTTEHVGSEQVRGVATERYRLIVDRKLAGELSQDDGGSETYPVDVWIGADGVVRRMQTEDPPGTSATLEFFDFGASVEIEAPPPEQVADEEEVESDEEVTQPCPGGTTAPLTEHAVETTLAGHGIPLERMSSGCDEGVAVSLANVLDGQSTREGARGDVRGFVICELRVRPSTASPWRLRRDDDGASPTFTLANLECSLFSEDESAEGDVAALEAGLRALERTLR